MPKKSKAVSELLAKLPQPQRATLKALRAIMLELLPDAEECISYGLPAYRVQGKVIGGYAATKKHCSYYPFSGSTLPALRKRYAAQFAPYKGTKSALHFPLDRCMPRGLIQKLIRERLKST